MNNNTNASCLQKYHTRFREVSGHDVSSAFSDKTKSNLYDTTNTWDSAKWLPGR